MYFDNFEMVLNHCTKFKLLILTAANYIRIQYSCLINDKNQWHNTSCFVTITITILLHNLHVMRNMLFLSLGLVLLLVFWYNVYYTLSHPEKDRDVT